jgi:hypothetical protein
MILLHEGSRCEVEALVDRLDGNASQPSWAWLEVLSKKSKVNKELQDFNNINKIEIDMHWCA